ncbi:unnamed protein product [Boreogadus saida]
MLGEVGRGPFNRFSDTNLPANAHNRHRMLGEVGRGPFNRFSDTNLPANAHNRHRFTWPASTINSRALTYPSGNLGNLQVPICASVRWPIRRQNLNRVAGSVYRRGVRVQGGQVHWSGGGDRGPLQEAPTPRHRMLGEVGRGPFNRFSDTNLPANAHNRHRFTWPASTITSRDLA